MGARVVARFRSQTAYGEFGHLICTPCSFLVGINFVVGQGQSAPAWLTPQRVDGYMLASHALYEAGQVPRRKIALEELQRFLPEYKGLRVLAAAGMTGPPHAFTPDDELRRVEGLAVLPLHTLLTHARGLVAMYDAARAAIVETSAGHTVCHTLDSRGRHHIFDPLGATLSEGCLEQLAAAPAVPYSGLVLFDAAPVPMFSVAFSALSHAASRA